MPLDRTIRIHTTPVTRLRPHHANGEHASGRCIGPNATQVELTSVKEIVGAKTRAAPAVTGITVSFKLDPRLTQGYQGNVLAGSIYQ